MAEGSLRWEVHEEEGLSGSSGRILGGNFSRSTHLPLFPTRLVCTGGGGGGGGGLMLIKDHYIHEHIGWAV